MASKKVHLDTYNLTDGMKTTVSNIASQVTSSPNGIAQETFLPAQLEKDNVLPDPKNPPVLIESNNSTLSVQSTPKSVVEYSPLVSKPENNLEYVQANTPIANSEPINLFEQANTSNNFTLVQMLEEAFASFKINGTPLLSNTSKLENNSSHLNSDRQLTPSKINTLESISGEQEAVEEKGERQLNISTPTKREQGDEFFENKEFFSTAEVSNKLNLSGYYRAKLV